MKPGAAPVGRVAAAALPAMLLAWHRIDAVDFWSELATGRFIVRHGLPAQDPFGTARGGAWIIQDWLASAGTYVLHLLGGSALVVAGAAITTAVALALPGLAAARARERTWPFEIALLLSTLIAYERFFVRSELMTFACSAGFAFVLARGAPRRAREVLAFAAVQALWANCHAGFVVGPLLCVAALAARVWDVRRGTERVVRWHVALAGACTLACAVTPYGLGILVHVVRAWRDTGAAALRAGVVEWQPTFAAPVAGDVTLMAFVAALAGLLVSVVLRRKEVRAFDLLAVAIFTALGMTARRHLLLFAAVVPPLAARGWSRAAGPRAPEPAASRAAPGPLRRFAASIPALVALAMSIDIGRGGFYARFGPPRTLGWGVSDADFPIRAVDFVATHGLKGPLFNNLAAGSYLVWRVGERMPVWEDGRLLDLDRFRRTRQALGSGPAFDALAAAANFDLVVLALQPFAPVALLHHLFDSQPWSLVFMDGEGAVFVRGANAASVAALAADRPLPADMAPTGGRGHGRCDGGDAARRGRVLLDAGRFEAARADLERAALACPERWDVTTDWAHAVLGCGDRATAEPMFERAVRHDPLDTSAWRGLGDCRAAAGDTAAALDRYRRALAIDPTDESARRAVRALGH